MSETVAVIGAGIGGLCAALALAPTGRRIVIAERDPPPPGSEPDEVFNAWRHTGVGHLRQSHAFLARLRTIIRTEHPRLLEDLLALGVRELPFTAMLTEQQLAGYAPEPEDADLTIITSRRTTLELAMRRYVETLETVEIRSDFMVTRLKTERDAEGRLVVTGLEGAANGAPAELAADLVVDASGRLGSAIDQLREAGAVIPEESETAGILYFTRHYRLRPGMEEPPRIGNPPASGDLGYIKFGVFPGDNGCFSITVAIPEIELELRKAILDPDVFHQITLGLPGLAPWTNAERSEPVGRVHGMGDLVSRWRDLVADGAPQVRGYFALGDTLVRTNPLYGRGCSFAAVSAQLLRETLEETADPSERLLAYHRRIHAEIRPYYLAQRAQDRSAIRRARNTLTPGYRKSLRTRLLESFFEDGVRIAMRIDTNLLRQGMRGFHMLEHPDAWLKRPANLARITGYWMRGRRANAAAYPPKAGPDRAALMSAIGLDPGLDIQRVAEAA